MEDKIAIPYNDVFFYGVTLRSRDTTDVRGDIFSNIFMKYLRTLQPVSNRLYRSSGKDKYEYNYLFVPSKPLVWRVIKNRRIIEDIEYLSDGKFCLNYYDDNGKDSKRVIYSNQNKWLKTNYYNTLYGFDLLYTIVPKELNGETVIMQYITGEAYPVTLRCCPLPTCDEILIRVLERVPEPEVVALTNYGLMYFACEETYNIYKQVLAEEEKKYVDAHTPVVFNTQEDIEGGFCFNVDSFDSTKTVNSILDLSGVEELTEEGFDIPLLREIPDTSEDFYVEDMPEVVEDYSIDKEISDAIRIISEETNISIDADFVLSIVSQGDSLSEAEASEQDSELFTDEIALVDKEDGVVSLDDKAEGEMIFDEPDVILINDDVDDKISDALTDSVTEEDMVNISDDSDEINLLTMDDDAIDDYVSTLIDSILQDAHSTASAYMIDKEEVFTQTDREATAEIANVMIADSDTYIHNNVADITLESNGAIYYYFGESYSNKRNGRGRTLMSDGKTAYEGQYSNDMRHGVGSFYYRDGGLCYWGDWQENLRNGFGLGISSETGVAHIGHWNQNKPEGVGVRFDKDGNFMYLDSASHRTNGGIRVTGFTDSSMFVEVWDEKTLKIIKKEISIEDLLK